MDNLFCESHFSPRGNKDFTLKYCLVVDAVTGIPQYWDEEFFTSIDLNCDNIKGPAEVYDEELALRLMGKDAEWQSINIAGNIPDRKHYMLIPVFITGGSGSLSQVKK